MSKLMRNFNTMQQFSDRIIRRTNSVIISQIWQILTNSRMFSFSKKQFQTNRSSFSQAYTIGNIGNKNSLVPKNLRVINPPSYLLSYSDMWCAGEFLNLLIFLLQFLDQIRVEVTFSVLKICHFYSERPFLSILPISFSL